MHLRGASEPTRFVDKVEYNAKGQRERIEYGNQTTTHYAYDRFNFRLTRLATRRRSDGALLQDLRHVYDPVGNITRITDDAQQTTYFNNQVVDPSAGYIYDALYQLVRATGREHIGQLAQPETNWDDAARAHLPLPGDGQAMRSYAETYEYDAVGNLLKMAHAARDGSWARRYAYDEQGHGNRLSSTTVGETADRYAYDTHGNTMTMPHLALMRWDFRDQLQASARQVQGRGSPETTYYVYDAAGLRVRKVTERASGGRKAERIYLGSFELYREYEADEVSLERATLHVMDDKQRVALVETRTRGQDRSPARLIRHQFVNQLGSSVLEVDERAGIISYEEYFPYGGCAYQSVRDQTETPKRYRYSGKERDEENGFYYHGARYYAPWLGRWISCDAGAAANGETLYGYVRNNPILYHDASGRDETKDNAADAEARQKALDQELAAQGLTAEQVRDVLHKTNGDLVDKYGFFAHFKLKKAVRALPDDLIIRASPGDFADSSPKPNYPVMGCVGGECYLNIPKQEFEQKKVEANVKRDLETASNIAGGIFGALGYGIASIFTDDPNKLHAASGIGSSIDAVAAAHFLTGKPEYHATEETAPRAAEVRPLTEVPKTEPPKRESKPADPSATRAFAHGTSPEYATNIQGGGLNEEAARAASRGGSANQPGSFHTHEIGPPGAPGPGLQAAYEWGLRQAAQPAVLIGILPEALVEELIRAGHLTVEPTPGAEPGFPQQYVFHPESYNTVNENVRWQVIRPGRR